MSNKPNPIHQFIDSLEQIHLGNRFIIGDPTQDISARCYLCHWEGTTSELVYPTPHVPSCPRCGNGERLVYNPEVSNEKDMFSM